MALPTPLVWPSMRGLLPNDPEPEECICPACGERSRVGYIDDGYGETEYWGSRSVHRLIIKVSRCCGEELYKEDII